MNAMPRNKYSATLNQIAWGEIEAPMLRINIVG